MFCLRVCLYEDADHLEVELETVVVAMWILGIESRSSEEQPMLLTVVKSLTVCDTLKEKVHLSKMNVECDLTVVS